jgi:hypothetical protein
MASVRVEAYEADWNPSNNANRIRIWIDGSTASIPLAVNTEPEFNGLLAMLSKPGVMWDTVNKYLHLGRRPAGT